MTTRDALEKYCAIAGNVFGTGNKMWDRTFNVTTLEAEMRKLVASSITGYTGDETMYDTTADGVAMGKT